MTANSELREQLVHCIYGMVNTPEQWPHALETLDALLQADPAQSSSELDALLPHIDRANLLLHEMNRLKLSQQQGQQILDHMPMAIMIVQPDGRIISSNQRALVLQKNPGISTNRGYLRFKKPKHQASFSNILNQVHSGNSQQEPLRLDHLNLWVCSHLQGQLAIFLSDHTSKRNICHSALMEMYGLTCKEASVTCELCNGKANLEETAGILGISLATARTHLKHVFAKTNTHNQAELMKMVLLNPALIIFKQEQESSHKDRLCQLRRLPSKRTVSYAEYGDPNGYPVLFCHAMSACRLMIPPDHRALIKQKIRLIVPDRAGFGHSSQAEGDVMEQWLQDSRLLLSQLGVEHFNLIGHSGGGAFAMALAAECPEQIQSLHLISSIAPATEADDLQLFLPVNRMAIHLCQSKPAIARIFLQLTLKTLSNKPASYFKHIQASMPDIDDKMLPSSKLKEQLIEWFDETHRQGVDHIVDELLYITNHWRVNPAEINCPVFLWHGEQDPIAPPALMHRFISKLTDCRTQHWVKNCGHYLLFSHWADISKSLHPKI